MVQDVKSDLSHTITTELRAVCNAVTEKDLEKQRDPNSVKAGWMPEETDFIPFGSMGRVFLLEKAVERLTELCNTAPAKVDTCEANCVAFGEKLDVTLERLVQELDENTQRDLIVKATVDQQLENIKAIQAD